ncbi:hypothetical protein AAMO2058_000308000 [Amorphochlora amoebiformis]
MAFPPEQVKDSTEIQRTRASEEVGGVEWRYVSGVRFSEIGGGREGGGRNWEGGPLVEFANHQSRVVRRTLRRSGITHNVSAIEDVIMAYTGFELKEHLALFFSAYQVSTSSPSLRLIVRAMDFRYRVLFYRSGSLKLQQEFPLDRGLFLADRRVTNDFMSLSQAPRTSLPCANLVLLEGSRRLAVRAKHDHNWGIARPSVKYLKRSLFKGSAIGTAHQFTSRYRMAVELVHGGSNSKLTLFDTLKRSSAQIYPSQVTPWLHHGVADYGFSIGGTALTSPDGKRQLRVRVSLKVCQPYSTPFQHPPYSENFDIYISGISMCYAVGQEEFSVSEPMPSRVRPKIHEGFAELTSDILNRSAMSDGWRNVSMMYQITTDAIYSPSPIRTGRWYHERLLKIMLQGCLSPTDQIHRESEDGKPPSKRRRTWPHHIENPGTPAQNPGIADAGQVSGILGMNPGIGPSLMEVYPPPPPPTQMAWGSM